MITDEALQAAVDLSVRYVPDRFLPGKAADLIDEAGSRVRMHRAPHTDEVHELSLDLQQIRRMKKAALEPQRLEDASELSRCEVELEAKFSELRAGRSTTANPPTVTPEDIAAVVARWRGVPVSSMAPEEEARRPASGEEE